MEEKQKEVHVSLIRRYTLIQHTCPVCGTEFEAPRLRVYCSQTCYRKAAWERNGQKANARRRAKRNEQADTK
jgi:hypothetical protein